MSLATKLLLVAQLSAIIISLPGCGGGDDPAVGEKMPTSAELQSTGRALDIGIAEAGMIVLQDKFSGQRTYSRFGRLDVDHDGRLIHSDGALVLGRASHASLDIAPLPEARFVMAPRATTVVSVEANLDSRLQATPNLATFDPADPSTYSNATALTIYKSDGLGLALILYFRRTDTDIWSVFATVDGRDVGIDFKLYFTRMGTLDARTSETLKIPAEAGRLTEQIKVELDSVTQFGSAFSVTQLRQDGYDTGNLLRVEVDPTGNLTMTYSNGESSSGGQLVLARFTILDRLTRFGDSSWQCLNLCGTPMVDFPGQKLLSILQIGALNVKY